MPDQNTYPCVNCGKPTAGSSAPERRMCIPCRPSRAAEREERRRQTARRYYEANKGRIATKGRERGARNREQVSAFGMKKRHGPLIGAWFAETWQAQDGRCCLCGDELPLKKAVVDHDHRCCPEKMSCAFCRRGLTCMRCNVMIGLAGDDPALLRTVADNLEAILKAADARRALKPAQGTLLLAVEAIPAPARLRAVSGGAGE